MVFSAAVVERDHGWDPVHADAWLVRSAFCSGQGGRALPLQTGDAQA